LAVAGAGAAPVLQEAPENPDVQRQ
jgi:hypothetical protein